VLGTLISCSTGNTHSSEATLLGNWLALTGNFEQISFTNEDTARFSGYLNDRLAMSGNWKLNGNKLIINYDNQETEEFVIQFFGDTLIFNNGDEVYVRYNENTEEDSSSYTTEILDEINQNLGMKFSNIKPFTENWLPSNLSWSIMSCTEVLDSGGSESVNDTYEQIVSLLSLEGFEPDTTMITEIVTGYTNRVQKILLRTSSNPETSVGDTVFVDVICGTPKVN
jgi:hypothetical protein